MLFMRHRLINNLIRIKSLTEAVFVNNNLNINQDKRTVIPFGLHISNYRTKPMLLDFYYMYVYVVMNQHLCIGTPNNTLYIAESKNDAG